MRIRTTLCLLASSAVLLLGLPGSLDAASKFPDWSLVGSHAVSIPVGAHSVAGRYGFDLGPFSGNVTLAYDGDSGRVTGGGSTGDVGSYFFSVDGTWELDAATGRPRVRFADAKKDPKFTFDGVLRADLLAIEGTHTRGPGFGFLDDSASGPLTIGRTPPVAAPDSFVLRFDAAQNLKGKVTAARVAVVGAKAPLTEATLQIYGNQVLAKGKLRGRVKSARDGTTTAKVRVKGKGWSVTLKGPMDADGFHALADVRSPILSFKGAATTLPVIAGPDEPPPPPPPAPRNLLDGAIARVANGLVTITRESASKRHFKQKADLTVQFASAAGQSVIHATPLTSGGQTPTRFFFTQSGGKTFGTATAPADVRIDVQALSLAVGGTIQLHATGETYTPQGKRILVDVIVLARVVP